MSLFRSPVCRLTYIILPPLSFLPGGPFSIIDYSLSLSILFCRSMISPPLFCFPFRWQRWSMLLLLSMCLCMSVFAAAVTLSLLLNSVAAFFGITGFNLEVAWLGPAAIAAAAAAANCEYVQLSFSFRQLALSLSHTVFCGCCLCPPPPLSRVLLHYHFRSTLITTTTTKECVPWTKESEWDRQTTPTSVWWSIARARKRECVCLR